MSDSNPSGPNAFMLSVIVLHWMLGAAAFICSFVSWKLLVIGATCWLLSGLLCIAIALDDEL